MGDDYMAALDLHMGTIMGLVLIATMDLYDLMTESFCTHIYIYIELINIYIYIYIFIHTCL